MKNPLSRRDLSVRVRNISRDVSLGERVELADTSLTRFIGLLGRRGVRPSGGLLIQPSNGVHTLGMMFSIDVLLLDRDNKVLSLYKSLAPFRVTRIDLKASSALELPAGMIQSTATQVGDQLVIEPSPADAS